MKRRGERAMIGCFHLRMLSEERRLMEEAASKRGLSVSDFARIAITEAAMRVAA